MTPTLSLCPSARCEEGALLLGVVESGGQVAFLPEPLEVDATFTEAARRGRAPERRFRFASTCLAGGCRQWTGGRCGVIDRVSALIPLELTLPALPDCAIRAHCRWFGQRGLEACGVCPLVVTDRCSPSQEAQVGGPGP